jgi:hypothetical protein
MVNRYIEVLKSSQVISHVNVELKPTVSDNSSPSIIRDDVVNDHVTDIYTRLSN